MKKIVLLVVLGFLYFSGYTQWVQYKQIPNSFSHFKNHNYDLEINNKGEVCFYSNNGNIMDDPKGPRMNCLIHSNNNQTNWDTKYINYENGINLSKIKCFNNYFYYVKQNKGFSSLNYLNGFSEITTFLNINGSIIDYCVFQENQYVLISPLNKKNERILLHFKEYNIFKSDTLKSFSPKKVFFINDTLGYLVSTNHIIEYSKGNFDVIYSNFQSEIVDFCIISETLAYMLNSKGELFKTNDKLCWKRIETHEKFIKQMFFNSESLGFVLDSNNVLYSTIDNGNSFNEEIIDSENGNVSKKVFFINNNEVFVLMNNHLYRNLFEINKSDNDFILNSNINEENKEFFSLYPNPTNNKINITLTDPLSDHTKISI